MKDPKTRLIEHALKRSKVIADPDCIPHAAKVVTEAVLRDYDLEPRKVGQHKTHRRME